MVDFFDVFFTGADFDRNFNHKAKHDVFWVGDSGSNALTLEIYIPGYSKEELTVRLVEEFNSKYIELKGKGEDDYPYFKVLTPSGYKIPEDCKVENGIFSMKFEKYKDVKEINIL